MKRNRPILHDAWLALPLVVGVGLLVGGWPVAGATFLCGVLAIGNLAALAWLGSRFVETASRREGASLFALMILGKLFIAFFAVLLLLRHMPASAVVLGLCTPLLGVAIHGVRLALRGDRLAHMES